MCSRSALVADVLVQPRASHCRYWAAEVRSPAATVVTAGCAFVGAGRAARQPALFPCTCGPILCSAPLRSSEKPPSCFGPPHYGYRRDLCRLMRADAGSRFVCPSWSRLVGSLRSLPHQLPPGADGCVAVTTEPASFSFKRARTCGVGDLEQTNSRAASCIDAAFRASRASVKRGHWPSPWRSIHSYGLSID